MLEMQEKKQVQQDLEKSEEKPIQPVVLSPDEVFKDAEIDYERQDVSGSRIIGSFIIGTILVAIVMFFITQYFTISREREMLEHALKPESNLLRDVRQREEGMLKSYRVIDEKKGIYQIPISEAMKIIADEAYQRKKAALEMQEATPPKKEDAKTDLSPKEIGSRK
ncbi:MAG: hypothetical protein NZ844_05435 [Chloroherpetonaceae bacterium]|nr:hypothetical protein [Chloroherpetonaceae bacterium]